MGNRITAIANLKKKGAEANPNGRPKKGYSITEAFREMLDANPERKSKLVDKIMEKAEKGDPAAYKLIWQYMDGMPIQPVKLGGDEDNPIKLDVSNMLDKVYGNSKQEGT